MRALAALFLCALCAVSRAQTMLEERREEYGFHHCCGGRHLT
eukprot:gene9373-1407_t